MKCCICENYYQAGHIKFEKVVIRNKIETVCIKCYEEMKK